jgi:hypothetical protein
VEMDQPDSPRAKPYSLSRIVHIRNATELDPHCTSVREDGPDLWARPVYGTANYSAFLGCVPSVTLTVFS